MLVHLLVDGLALTKPPGAVLLWAKLYEITKNQTYLAAAELAAAAVQRNYLNASGFQINGGELDDVIVNDGHLPGGLNIHGISGGTYGVMGLSQLAIVTKKPEHIRLVRLSMDYMLAWQWTKEINIGCESIFALFVVAMMMTLSSLSNR